MPRALERVPPPGLPPECAFANCSSFARRRSTPAPTSVYHLVPRELVYNQHAIRVYQHVSAGVPHNGKNMKESWKSRPIMRCFHMLPKFPKFLADKFVSQVVPARLHHRSTAGVGFGTVRAILGYGMLWALCPLNSFWTPLGSCVCF